MKIVLDEIDIQIVKEIIDDECDTDITPEQILLFLGENTHFVDRWYYDGHIDQNSTVRGTGRGETDRLTINFLLTTFVMWVMQGLPKSQHNIFYKKGLPQPWTWPSWGGGDGEEETPPEYNAEFEANFPLGLQKRGIKIK